jgi:hypothetical protein
LLGQQGVPSRTPPSAATSAPRTQRHRTGHCAWPTPLPAR